MNAIKKSEIIYDALNQIDRLDFNNPLVAAVAGKELQKSI